MVKSIHRIVQLQLKYQLQLKHRHDGFYVSIWMKRHCGQVGLCVRNKPSLSEQQTHGPTFRMETSNLQGGDIRPPGEISPPG